MKARIKPRARAQGFTLVELMISMTLSLIIISAVAWVYQGTIQTYRSHDALSRMQESARYAFEIMGKDLRMAGAEGCSHGSIANAVSSPEDWYKNLFGQPIVSAEKNGAAGVRHYSDALTVLRADISHEYIVQSHNSVGAQFTLTAAHDIQSGQLLVATDCNNVAVFQATAATGNTVTHAVAGTPGNSTKNLGVAGAAYTYGAGTRLYRLHAATYYVDNNTASVPALFRLMPAGASATPVAEELVEGVEDMQISFGVDTTAIRDGQTDFLDPDGDGDPYLTGAQVDAAAGLGATVDARWLRVVSVKISLLMRTAEDRVAPGPQNVNFNGAPVIGTDRRLRKVFTHVIKLRNR